MVHVYFSVNVCLWRSLLQGEMSHFTPCTQVGGLVNEVAYLSFVLAEATN